MWRTAAPGCPDSGGPLSSTAIPLYTIPMATIPLDVPRGLVKRDRSPSAFVIYFYIWSKAGARGLRASLQTIAGETGFSKSAVQAAIRLLNRRRLIRTEKSSPTATPVHFVVKR